MKTLLVAFCVLLQSVVFACGGVNQQVYSGKIEYSFDPNNPYTCTVTVTLDFDINELVANDSIWANWGDYVVSTLHATSITEDSAASANMSPVHIYTHVYSGTHTYASLPVNFDGHYYISFQNEYGINGVTNIAGGDGINLPFYLSAEISIDTSASGPYPPLAFPQLQIGFSGLTNTFSQNGLQQSNDNSDSIVYTLMTPLETISNPVPEYQYPGQFCESNGTSTDSFGIDPKTGNVFWDNPCLQGVYGYATMLSRYRNGQLLSSIMRQQNIYVVDNGTAAVQNIAANNSMQLYPNPAQNYIEGTVNLTNTTAQNTLQIIAPDGRIVAGNIAITGGRFQANISQLSAGVYFVRMQGVNGGLVQRFVKQ